MIKNLGKIWIVVGSVVLIFILLFWYRTSKKEELSIDSTPINTTLSGTYVCLPYLDKKYQPKECVFGLVTDEGAYYMVNFGQSASAMGEFQSGRHITANGFVVLKEALNTNQWAPYDMKGIFTVTEREKK